MANLPKKPSTATVTAVKGHLVTKSSALAATGSCKLEAQFITAQNMASHYKRVINAKPTIDTLPPKSIVKSQKARDRARREMLSLNKSVDRAKSADSLRSSLQTEDNYLIKTTPRAVKSARGLKEEEIKPRQLPDRDKLNRSMSNLMSQFTTHSKTQRVLTYKPPTPTNFESNNDQKGLITNRSRASLEDKTRNALTTLLLNTQQDPNQPKMAHPALKAMSRLVGNHNYDVLDNHADKFKHPTREFVPRIKNTNSLSSLSKNSSCYQPPRRRRRHQQQAENLATTESKVSLRDYDERFNDNNENIEDYIEEEFEKQDEKMNRSASKLNRSKILNDEDEDDNENEFQTSFSKSKSNESDLKKIVDKEDNLKYLQFIKEVTNDILARGISSNRVINNCFENHIRKNRDKLNESKMRELLKTLKKDIGVKDDPEEDNENIDTTANYQTINKALNMDKKHREDNKSSEMNTSGGADYLTLKKLGWSNSENNNKQDESFKKTNKSDRPEEFIVSNIESGRSRNSSRRNSVKSHENINRSFHNFKETSRSNSRENNLTSSKNKINENDNKENSNPISEVLIAKQSSASRKSSNSSVNSVTKQSILKKTPSQQSIEQSSQQHAPQTQQQMSKKNDTDDDDDDIFASSYEPSQNKSPVKKRTQIIRSENSEKSEDIQFDDDYGPADDNDDDDDDDFSNVKSKNLKNTRKKSTESNGSLDIGESASLNTSLANKGPKPQPRKITTNKKEEDDDDDNSDDDEF